MEAWNEMINLMSKFHDRTTHNLTYPYDTPNREIHTNTHTHTHIDSLTHTY